MNIEQLESYNLADAVKFHNKLNPKLWDSSEHLKPEIREQLLLIAEDFAQSLGVKDLQIVDITVSGSNAAYTYTKHSDIDLHLVVDIPELNDEVYRELFNAKKTIYNSEHAIKVKGIDVELYVEPAGEPPHSQGIYSLLNNDWVVIPKRKRATIDDMSVRAKYEDLRDRIKKAISSKSEEEMTRLLHKIRELRQASLDQHGEFGPENLAFKMLRSQGDIEKLRTARTDAKSRELSLKERQPQQPVTYGYGADFVAEVGITPDGTNPTTCQFTNEEQSMSDEEILRDFIGFCVKELKVNELPNIKLRKDPQWPVMNKTFGRYTNDKNQLEVAWGNRHIMDVLRTVAHELTHKHQHERDGERMGPEAGETGSEWENEANARAGILMRDYARLHPDYFAVGQVHGLHESVLDETVQDERFLQKVGNSVAKWVEQYKATAKGRARKFLEPGTLGQVTGIKGNTDAENHLLNLGLIFLAFPDESMGSYRPAEGKWTGDVGLNIHYLYPDAALDKTSSGQKFKHQLRRRENDVTSTVAHELRHALDDYLSKGQYDKSAHKFDYWDTNVELNAFFTQALNSLQKMIDEGTVDESNLQWAIRRVFYNNEFISNLIAKKDPRVKRLYSRAYNYFKSSLDDEQQLKESSGYIPTAAEAHDPRFEMALSVDIHPGALGKAANAFLLNTDSQGHPQELRPDGMVQRMMEEYKRFKKKTSITENIDAFHGSFNKNITSFTPLTHFGSKQAATTRLVDKAKKEKLNDAGEVYQVNLNINNPAPVKDFNGNHSATKFAFDLKANKIITQDEMLSVTEYSGTPKAAENLIKLLKSKGYDGMYYKNKWEDKGHTSYVILDPQQAQIVKKEPAVTQEPVTESKSVAAEIKEFLSSLSPEDVGVEEFNNYRVHYEGFSDFCQSSSDYKKNPEAVYKEVFNDFVKRENGASPVKSGMIGDENYPILFSIFKVNNKKSSAITTPEQAYQVAYKRQQPWPTGSKEEQLIRKDWQLSAMYDKYLLGKKA